MVLLLIEQCAVLNMVGKKCNEKIQILFAIKFTHKIFICFCYFIQHTCKCEVDSINGVDKNITYREAMKHVADPKKVCNSSSSNVQAFLMAKLSEKKIIVLMQTVKL